MMTDTDSARLAVGLMSGTSCDGVDAAFVQINGPVHAPKVEFVAFAYLPYLDALRKRLLDPEKSGAEICTLNVELAEAFAAAALTAIARAGHAPADVAFIASHGHTLCHYPPDARSAYRGTLQLGEAAYIAEKTGCDVVSNFRPRDMAAGGQGAPLVPYADWLLFRRTGQAVATLNIGGIANFTVLPEKANEVYAFDSGPGNMLIDGCLSLLGRESRYDAEGALAAEGKTIPELRDAILAHEYFNLPPPKSTGREMFGVEAFLKPMLASRAGLAAADIAATVTEATADSIAGAFHRFIAARHEVDEIVTAGGGVFNRALMTMLRERLTGVTLRLTSDYGIPVDAREAIAFALLGDAFMAGVPASMPGATGASRSVILGTYTPGSARKNG